MSAGLSTIYDSFNILHMMHHEATACHVTQVGTTGGRAHSNSLCQDLRELLVIFAELVRTVRSNSRSQELRAMLSRWKDMAEMTSRLLSLCNSFSSHDLREACLEAVREMLRLWPNEVRLHILI